MPYQVRKVSDSERPYKIVRRDSGKQVGSSKSAKNAAASIRARMAGAHGGHKRSRGGFTAVDVALVIAIIGLFVAILITARPS